MSSEHFVGILTQLTCQGSKGQRSLASLGTAQRLAPVHSGLPLCETCLSSAAHILHIKIPSVFSSLTKIKQAVDDSGFVVQESIIRKWKSSPCKRFSIFEAIWSCTTPLQSIGQNMPYPALCFTYRCAYCQIASPFCFFFSKLVPVLS